MAITLSSRPYTIDDINASYPGRFMVVDPASYETYRNNLPYASTTGKAALTLKPDGYHTIGPDQNPVLYLFFNRAVITVNSAIACINQIVTNTSIWYATITVPNRPPAIVGPYLTRAIAEENLCLNLPS